jgi:hypothetical protein
MCAMNVGMKKILVFVIGMNKMIILDMMAGDNCHNDKKIIEKMIDSVADIYTRKRKVIFKWQLFNDIPGLNPLKEENYLYAVEYAKDRGFSTFASVFDRGSLNFYLNTKPNRIKIACREKLYDFLDYIPSNILVYMSIDSPNKKEKIRKKFINHDIIFLNCVAEYPALENVYRSRFGPGLSFSISDHTENLNLYTRYNPIHFEKHFTLQHGFSSDPYGDSFCVTPEDLEGII